MRHDRELSPTQDMAIRPAPTVVTTRVGEEVVLLDVDGGDYYSLNETAGRVWDFLAAAGDKGVSAEAAATLLQREYGDPDGRVLADVCALVRDLTHARLAVPTGAKSGRAR